MLIRLHQFDAAIDELRSRADAHPSLPSVHQLLSDAYRLKHMNTESAEEWEKALTIRGEQAGAEAARRMFAKGGMKALLAWRLKEAQEYASKNYVSPYDLAFFYARLKRKEQTLHCLEQHISSGRDRWYSCKMSRTLIFCGPSPPGYQAIVRKMGLPAAQ